MGGMLQSRAAPENGNHTAGSNDEAAKDTTSTNILNETLGLNLQLLDHHVWVGSVFGTYPLTINRGATRGITTRGNPPGDPAGSKVAVVYAGSNVKDGPNNCAWLVAWHVPAYGSTSSKVYVEAGDISKYSGKIDWDEIESKLDASSDQMYYVDDYTRSIASAAIVLDVITKIKVLFDVAQK